MILVSYPDQYLTALSSWLGWLYFICWGISGYPPLILNRQLRSVEGISLDFLFLNCWGYVSYLVSTLLLYFNDTVRRQYILRHQSNSAPLIRANDVAYVVHGAVLTFSMLAQTYCCGYRRPPRGQHRLSKPAKFVLTLGVMISVGSMVVALAMDNKAANSTWQWLDVALVNGHVKILMSTCKYVPQVWWNYRRRSTHGWSMLSMGLDIAGGLFSLAQLALDAYLVGDLSKITSNMSKLILALLTLTFDLVFWLQYYAYRKFS